MLQTDAFLLVGRLRRSRGEEQWVEGERGREWRAPELAPEKPPGYVLVF